MTKMPTPKTEPSPFTQATSHWTTRTKVYAAALLVAVIAAIAFGVSMLGAHNVNVPGTTAAAHPSVAAAPSAAASPAAPASTPAPSVAAGGNVDDPNLVKAFGDNGKSTVLDSFVATVYSMQANQQVATGELTPVQVTAAMPLVADAVTKATTDPTTLVFPSIISQEPGAKTAGPVLNGVGITYLRGGAPAQGAATVLDRTHFAKQPSVRVDYTISATYFFTEKGKYPGIQSVTLTRPTTLWLLPTTDPTSDLKWTIADYDAAQQTTATAPVKVG